MSHVTQHPHAPTSKQGDEVRQEHACHLRKQVLNHNPADPVTQTLIVVTDSHHTEFSATHFWLYTCLDPLNTAFPCPLALSTFENSANLTFSKETQCKVEIESVWSRLKVKSMTCTFLFHSSLIHCFVVSDGGSATQEEPVQRISIASSKRAVG